MFNERFKVSLLDRRKKSPNKEKMIALARLTVNLSDKKIVPKIVPQIGLR